MSQFFGLTMLHISNACNVDISVSNALNGTFNDGDIHVSIGSTRMCLGANSVCAVLKKVPH